MIGFLMLQLFFCQFLIAHNSNCGVTENSAEKTIIYRTGLSQRNEVEDLHIGITNVGK